MALFRRRPPVPDTAPDEAFPFWSGSVADEFRELVRVAFARAGSTVRVHPDHVVDQGGTQFGLANLAATCLSDEAGRRAWPKLIEEHVHRIIASIEGPSPFDALTEADVLAATYCRLMPTADLVPALSYAQEVAPGVARVFNLDLPETVAYFMDEHVERYGLDTLAAAGLRNLRDVREDRRETLEHSGGVIEVLLGESVFIGSQLLLLDEVAARHGFAIDPDLGAFVAIPNRNQLVFHVPRDRSVIASLQLLVGFAQAGYHDAVGPITPDVYWWRPGAVERISSIAEDGPRIEVGAELNDRLTRLIGE